MSSRAQAESLPQVADLAPGGGVAQRLAVDQGTEEGDELWVQQSLFGGELEHFEEGRHFGVEAEECVCPDVPVSVTMRSFRRK